MMHHHAGLAGVPLPHGAERRDGGNGDLGPAQAVGGRPHGLKYRLYCGRGNRCLVRCDNETGKGDHRHYGDREESYRFESLEKLLEDFREDCTRLAGWRWR
jgi:hypothetical protein